MGIEENKKFDRVWKIVGIVFVVGCVLLVGFVIHGCVSGNRDDNWKRLYKKEYVSEDGKYEYRVGVNKNEKGKIINYYAIITDVLKFDDPEAIEFTFPSEVDGYVVEQLGFVLDQLGGLVKSSFFLSLNDVIKTVFIPETIEEIAYGEGKGFFKEWSALDVIVLKNEKFVLTDTMIYYSYADIIVVSRDTYERYEKNNPYTFSSRKHLLKIYDEWIQEIENN